MTLEEDAGPPVTLASLIWGWRDAYAIGYSRDQWTAARRDGQCVITAHTLAGLETALTIDHRTRPAPRTFDPPASDAGDGDDEQYRPGPDESFLLTAMQAAFPAWAISYEPGLGAWVARTRKKTICQGSAVLLCAALLLIEQRYRQHTSGGPP